MLFSVKDLQLLVTRFFSFIQNTSLHCKEGQKLLVLGITQASGNLSGVSENKLFDPPVSQTVSGKGQG